MKTVDITPTWESLVPSLLTILENPKCKDSVKTRIRQELLKCAKVADMYIKLKEEYTDA